MGQGKPRPRHDDGRGLPHSAYPFLRAMLQSILARAKTCSVSFSRPPSSSSIHHCKRRRNKLQLSRDHRLPQCRRHREDRQPRGIRRTCLLTTLPRGVCFLSTHYRAACGFYRTLPTMTCSAVPLEANPTTPVHGIPTSPTVLYNFTDHNGFENPSRQWLLKNKSHEKIIDWDGTLKTESASAFCRMPNITRPPQYTDRYSSRPPVQQRRQLFSSRLR